MGAMANIVVGIVGSSLGFWLVGVKTEHQRPHRGLGGWRGWGAVLLIFIRRSESSSNP